MYRLRGEAPVREGSGQFGWSKLPSGCDFDPSVWMLFYFRSRSLKRRKRFNHVILRSWSLMHADSLIKDSMVPNSTSHIENSFKETMLKSRFLAPRVSDPSDAKSGCTWLRRLSISDRDMYSMRPIPLTTSNELGGRSRSNIEEHEKSAVANCYSFHARAASIISGP